MRVRGGALAGLGVLLGGLLAARPAAAWIFPEHAEITRFELDHELTPELRAQIELLLDEATESPPGGTHTAEGNGCHALYQSRVRGGNAVPAGAIEKGCASEWLPLCHDLTVPFSRVWEREADACIPFSVLPALAGDHALDAAELRKALFDGDWRVVTALPRFGTGIVRRDLPLAYIAFDVSHRFADFLDDASTEVARLYRNGAANGDRGSSSSDGARHRFFRSLDVRLQALDKGYSDRAQGSRSHFQDSSVPIETLLRRAADAGDVDNALAQTFAHHLRSLELSYAAGSAAPGSGRWFASEALLEHALALHFMEDAFAAGHFGTEHAVGALERLRRHDYLNRVGLPAMNVMSVRGCNSVAAAEDKDKEGDRCWIAYGDGYLDAINASHAARGTAHLSAQLAMAFARGQLAAKNADAVSDADPPKQGKKRRKKAADRAKPLWDAAVEACLPTSRETGTPTEHKGTLLPDAGEQATGTDPMIVRDGANTLHIYRQRLTKGSLQRVSAVATGAKPAFSPSVSVYAAAGGRVATSDDDERARRTEVTFRVEETGDYLLAVGSQEPKKGGEYTLTIAEVAMGPVVESSCKRLFELAALVDPVPEWTRANFSTEDPVRPSVEDRATQARRVLSGVDDALDQVDKWRRARPKHEFLAPAQAGAHSSARRGTLTEDLVGHPLTPCQPSTDHQDALCDGRAEYRFGDVDVSIVRPILAIWPGPTLTIESVRGEDSFGVGVAGQAIFGAGVAGAVTTQVPWAVSPFMFGLGLSGRFDNLLPGGRVNREIVGVNLAAFPMALSGVADTRYVLAGFGELRIPVWALLGALTSGTAWDLFSAVDLGPTGARLYFTLPDRSDSNGRNPFRLLGWDVEVLNVRISPPATSARTASIGLGMDTELRVRLGSTNLSRLDSSFPVRYAMTIGLEVASGYSVFLWQKQ